MVDVINAWKGALTGTLNCDHGWIGDWENVVMGDGRIVGDSAPDRFIMSGKVIDIIKSGDSIYAATIEDDVLSFDITAPDGGDVKHVRYKIMGEIRWTDIDPSRPTNLFLAGKL